MDKETKDAPLEFLKQIFDDPRLCSKLDEQKLKELVPSIPERWGHVLSYIYFHRPNLISYFDLARSLEIFEDLYLFHNTKGNSKTTSENNLKALGAKSTEELRLKDWLLPIHSKDAVFLFAENLKIDEKDEKVTCL
jgi:hypothetical protein